MKKRFAALDDFRLFAAVLVVAIHTSPLTNWNPEADFWFTRVFARVAVPFFFMSSGYFLARKGWQGIGRFIRHALLLYGVSIVLYLPLNLYADSFPLAELPKKLCFDGTFYHLWYLPAVVIGVLIARGLYQLGRFPALTISGLLYLIGLGGDSYFGLIDTVPALHQIYDGLFLIFSYTRNGIFFAPFFLLLGAAVRRRNIRFSGIGFCIALALMSIEAFSLHGQQVQRHDSMYLLLPLVMFFLFSCLLSLNTAQNHTARGLSMLVYLVHPWCIVLVRMAAKLLHLENLLIENSFGHFAAVLASSFAVAGILQMLRPMPVHPAARAWREIDSHALWHNAAMLQQQAGRGCTLMAVVKADAYGHGAVPVAKCLQKAGVRAFAVASLAEGIALRKKGIRGIILILGYTMPAEAGLLARWRLTQTVVDETHAQALSAQGFPLRVHLALDTGMHRLGIPAYDFAALQRIYALPNLKIEGVFSHLCMADSLAPNAAAYTGAQMDAFYETVDQMYEHGLAPGKVHLQASYGILNLPAQPCDFLRAGIALYGVYSDTKPVAAPLDLLPVLSLRARVGTVRRLAAGQSAGYGCAFTAQRDSVLAVAAIGYADGLPREMAAYGAKVLIHGQFAPVVGWVCMDQMLIDATGIDGICSGDIVTLIGQDGNQVIHAETLAEQCGTITNELLSRLGSRLGIVVK